jgi:hypothetical protein
MEHAMMPSEMDLVLQEVESEAVEPAVIGVPQGVPQAVNFAGENIYVRKCYPEYYKLLLDKLNKKHIKMLSITGTPGIGKSAFYLYFQTRYRRDNPENKIALVSFAKDRTIMTCKVWKTNGTLTNHEENIPRSGCDLYLYDGPPDMKPQSDSSEAKMVAFTCPNHSWFNSITRDSSHQKMHMPNWTYMELQEAIVELSLSIDDEELMKRYSLFGGSARYCLSVDTDFVAQGKVDLKQALSKIKSLADVQSCFGGSSDLGGTVHRLMHCVIPNPQQLFIADLVPASVEVSIMMKEKLDKDLDHERVKLMHWLDGSGKASTFSDWLFENFVHELFQKGGKFKRRRLAMNSEAAPDLTLAEQTGIYKRFKEKMAFDQIFRSNYHTPDSANLQSVDSFCYFASLRTNIDYVSDHEKRHPPCGFRRDCHFAQEVGTARRRNKRQSCCSACVCCTPQDGRRLPLPKC